MKTLLLIDANALIHRMYHALAPLTGPNDEPVGAIYGLSKLLLKIKADQRPDYVAACFDRPEPTFREADYKEYKATRVKAEDDLVDQIIHSRDVFDVFKIKTFELARFEADDLIGTLSERYKNEDNLQTIVYSGDKDLLQLVEGDKVVVDLIRNGGKVVQYNEDRVKEEFGLNPAQITDLKGLMGDSSDNIPGVANVGPKTATPLIQEFGSIEEIYENLVIINPKVAKKLEGNKDIALLSKKLATINKSAPIYLDKLEDLKAPDLDLDELKKYFNHYGFVSLVNQLETII
ncbi:MAG: hypothetical protein COU09_01195 [Candidatus Harrisonbacteria bacterium CG10_big_fil_rev_8_21_14_0_10_44_23]|uniref:5'-3' exonuclease domain-containing protein n=1 Tax=Candidatus Harrisonbacteria bacterium CG10_big_fil_rev_8_21_14_0_10_44_23 TaxID=1974585 RepID=A0A2H0UQ74_9BACT|nr:MAG: hypothetical protein COU09_01195 [Candidatus Harrisonbacteria bacterium CG10_big_fil_rev_8_21_14_0_10_44_23]